MTQIETKQTLMFHSSVMFDNDVKPTFRDAHFLKTQIPSLMKKTEETLFNNPPIIPNNTTPLSPKINKTLSKKIKFDGWNPPLKKWKSWVDKMRPVFETQWKKASIFEAIMFSTVKINKCKSSVFALADRWCPMTNTFTLPWGEVTVTLEDVLVCGGLSISGTSASSLLLSSPDSARIIDILEDRRLLLNESSAKKASHQQWLDWWTGPGIVPEVEHEAFLSLWLSRYVFPGNDRCAINKTVFPIAIQLSRGTRISLAPSVLASIYRDLRVLKEKLEAARVLSDDEVVNVDTVKVVAPFHLLQVWFWERFPSLSPHCNAQKGSCRLQRWDDMFVYNNKNTTDVGARIDQAGAQFKWRPYTGCLNGWPFEFDRVSYRQAIRVSRLVGLDCTEWYFPHRVAMQFGMDQDIPIGPYGLSNFLIYDRLVGDNQLYRPPKICQSGVTPRYFYWYRARGARGTTLEWSVSEADRIRTQNEAAVPPGLAPLSPNEAVVSSGFRPRRPKDAAVPSGSRPRCPKDAAVPSGSRPRRPKAAAVPSGSRPRCLNDAAVPLGSRPRCPEVLPGSILKAPNAGEASGTADRYKRSCKRPKLSLELTLRCPGIDEERTESNLGNSSLSSQVETVGVLNSSGYGRPGTELFRARGSEGASTSHAHARARALLMNRRQRPFSSSQGNNIGRILPFRGITLQGLALGYGTRAGPFRNPISPFHNIVALQKLLDKYKLSNSILARRT